MFSKKSICSVILTLCLLLTVVHFPASSYASDPVTWELETLDGDPITESTYTDEVQLLVFYNATEGECGKSMWLIEELGSAEWVGQDGLRVIAIDAQNNDADAVAAFRSKHAPDSNMVFALDGSFALWSYFHDESGYASITYCGCVILKDGAVQEIWNGCYSAEECQEKISLYLETIPSPPSRPSRPSRPAADPDPDPDEDSGLLQVEIPGQFRQTEMRGQLEMINAFRADPDAWYWNEDNTEKVYPNHDDSTKLKPLAYDYKLEQIAMQRAAELAVSFSHTRPDGTMCYTLTYMDYNPTGENIAMGQRSAEAAFIDWCEEDEPYEWQGHRRSMLYDQFNVVGLGAFEHNGVTYWVQEFGYADFETEETEASDEQVMSVVESLPENVDPMLYSYDKTVKIFKELSLSVSDEADPLRFKHELKKNEFIAENAIPEEMTVLVSSFDENGRYLGLSEMTAEEYAAAQQGASDVKVLCIDAAFSPLSEAMDIPLE